MDSHPYIRYMKKLLLVFVFAVSCTSKNSTPTPVVPAVPAFTCKIDGVSYSPSLAPQVVIKKGYSTVPQSHLGDDALYVFVDNPNNSGEANVQLTFRKDFGSPDSDYKLSDIAYDLNNNNAYVATHYTSNLVGSIQQTSTGAWSGTFAGDRLYPTITSTTSHITLGVFTEAKP